MISKKYLIIGATIAIFTLPVYANDRGIEGIGGTFHLIKKEHHSVTMVSEKIFMDIYPTYYDVKVEFIFQNDSKLPVTVKMGFPENAYGDIAYEQLKKKSGFLKFKTSVNGKSIQVSKREVINSGEGSVSAHWIKEVKFKAMEKLKVQAEYRSKMGIMALPGIYTEYEFTGGNWKGKVKESNLVATLHLPNNYSIYYDYDSTSKDIVKKGNKIYFNRKNWEAEYPFTITFKRTK